MLALFLIFFLLFFIFSILAYWTYRLTPLMARVDVKGHFQAVDFWSSLCWNRKRQSLWYQNKKAIQAAKALYDQFCNFSAPSFSAIPKRLHFIKTASSLAPGILKSWQITHPDWDICIWELKEFNNFDWSNESSMWIYKRSQDTREKIALASLEILYQKGGVYVSNDMFCLKPLDDLLVESVDFLAGLDDNQLDLDSGMVLSVSSKLIGSIRQGHLIKMCLDQFRSKEEAPFETLLQRCEGGLLSKICEEVVTDNPSAKVLLLPSSYFFPVPGEVAGFSPKKIISFLANESMAVSLGRGGIVKES